MSIMSILGLGHACRQLAPVNARCRPRICSSVKRLLFIRLLPSFLRTRRTGIYSGSVFGGQVTDSRVTKLPVNEAGVRTVHRSATIQIVEHISAADLTVNFRLVQYV